MWRPLTEVWIDVRVQTPFLAVVGKGAFTELGLHLIGGFLGKILLID